MGKGEAGDEVEGAVDVVDVEDVLAIFNPYAMVFCGAGVMDTCSV